MKNTTSFCAQLQQHLMPVVLLRICFILLHNDGIASSILSAIADPLHSWSTIYSSSIRQLIILGSDVIGAVCIYRIGMAVIDSETDESELELQRRGADLLIPGVMRSEKGWIFGLPTKIAADGSKDETDAKASTLDAHKVPILSLRQLPLIAAILYLINPISALAAAHSVRSIWDVFLLISFCYATAPTDVTRPTGGKCAFFLALATNADVAYGVFIVPILLWRGLARDMKSVIMGCHCDWKIVLGLFGTCYAGLQLLTLHGKEKGLVDRLLPNLAFVEKDDSGSFSGPNMGLHWYFVVQMFDRFRPYFSVFIGALPSVFVIPLTIRLHRYPSVLAAVFQLLWSIFRPVATVHTLTLGLVFVLFNPRSIIRMRDSSLVALFALPVPISLFVTFYDMWLVTGNGNPNYLFFQCFAYGLFVAIILLDVVSATVKRDKVRRMAEKGEFHKKTDKDEGEEVDATKGEFYKKTDNDEREEVDATSTIRNKSTQDDATNQNISETDEMLESATTPTEDGPMKEEPIVVFL